MKEIIKKEIALNRKATESLLSDETVSAIAKTAKIIISSLKFYQLSFQFDSNQIELLTKLFFSSD